MARTLLTMGYVAAWLSLSMLSSAAQPTPPGSFLKHRVSSVSELVGQVSRDNVARARYARHFGLSPGRVPSFLAGLKLVTLTKSTRARSYYLGPGSAVRSKTKLLPRGSQVFASAQGRPLIAWSCGNPLRVGIPAVPPKKQRAGGTAAPNARNVMSSPPTAEAPVETKVLAQPAESVGQPPIASAPGIVGAEPVMGGPAAPLVLAEAPTVAMPAAVAAAAAPPVSAGFNALPVVGGVAGLIGGLAALGGSSNPSTPPEQPPIVPIVPEPSTVAALAMMSSCLVLARRFRKQ